MLGGLHPARSFPSPRLASLLPYRSEQQQLPGASPAAAGSALGRRHRGVRAPGLGGLWPRRPRPSLPQPPGVPKPAPGPPPPRSVPPSRAEPSRAPVPGSQPPPATPQSAQRPLPAAFSSSSSGTLGRSRSIGAGPGREMRKRSGAPSRGALPALFFPFPALPSGRLQRRLRAPGQGGAGCGFGGARSRGGGPAASCPLLGVLQPAGGLVPAPAAPPLPRSRLGFLLREDFQMQRLLCSRAAAGLRVPATALVPQAGSGRGSARPPGAACCQQEQVAALRSQGEQHVRVCKA